MAERKVTVGIVPKEASDCETFEELAEAFKAWTLLPGGILNVPEKHNDFMLRAVELHKQKNGE
jgi:hypothetical protein